jgi:hypothetical protein
VIPAVIPICNQWDEWRNNKKLGANLTLTIVGLFVAWTLVYFGSEQVQKSAAEQSAKLLVLQKNSSDIITWDQDLQDDLNSLRVHFDVNAHRTRAATSEDGTNLTLHVTDSVASTVTRAVDP